MILRVASSCCSILRLIPGSCFRIVSISGLGASLILNERRVFDTAMARVAISGRGIAAKGDGAGAFWGSGAYEGARISG